ncbi:MAG: NAD-dependent epimerase/dehydratase family protein, partial [Nitrospirae bacterium]|nr:NAD-dependent epimerase/dehydratase family protein [Nitrospirota bacterium]
RIDRLFKWLGLGPTKAAQLQVLEAYLDRPGFGLDKSLYDSLAGQTDEMIHCASNTSFSERKRREIETANIDGLRNVLDFAGKSRCCFFHHMSTAYAAGRRHGLCREEQIETATFTNVYEETKYRGERMISHLCHDQGIRLNIYRPSIVCGDSRTGRTLLFNALYYPIRTVLFFRNLYENDIKEKGGKRAGQMGVRMDANGTVHLPIRIEAEEEGGINLIPIDYLVAAFLEIMDTCLDGGLFHIVNQKLTPVRELVDYTRRFFHVDGIETVRPGTLVSSQRNSLEILFDHYIEAYRPYMMDDRIFEDRKAREVLEQKDIECPDFDFGMFTRCMNYAVRSEWGQKPL